VFLILDMRVHKLSNIYAKPTVKTVNMRFSGVVVSALGIRPR